MKADKTRKKDIKKLGMGNNTIQAKDRIVNSIVFTVVLCIAVFIISRLV